MVAHLKFTDTPECTKDPELFFPTGSGSLATMQNEQAKSICRRCPFRAECLAWAIEHDERGIWGGTTRDERHQAAKVAGPKRMTRYKLYEITEKLIREEGLSLAQCATRLGRTYSHISTQRNLARKDMHSGKWRP